MIAWWLGGELGADGGIVWTAPQWMVLLAAAGALLAWASASVGTRPLWARAVELTSWGLALGACVVAVAGPVWVEEQGRTVPGRVAVLVDGSRSMGVLEDGEPRFTGVQPVLDHIRGEVGDADVYTFGDDLYVGPPSAYDLPGTDLEGALMALSERVAGEDLAAVVVVSDGLDRGLLRRGFMRDEAPETLDLPGPLTVFQVGELSGVVDLAVRGIDAGGYAFIRSAFAIEASIEGLGFADRTVPVSLLRDGALVTQQRVTLDEDGLGRAEFEVIAEDAGRFTYTVSVPSYEGDAVPSNNSMPVVVKVVRDRIRVLQVAGSPSWDVKVLRRFLKGDPSVQLVSFFILRTQRDLNNQYDDGELSLIQFPYERLFAEDLWTFDVVIFQNFDYQPYFSYRSQDLLTNLQKYVEGGGSLVMIGGDRSFGLGRYGGTPLASVLPVEIPMAANEPDLEPFQPLLTDDGARHPLTRLAADPVENTAWWGRLHPMDGTNVVSGALSDATVLLTHPDQKGRDGEPLPVLSVREVGAGRSMALTVDTSWRWSLSEAAQGRGNQAYLRFWKNAIRWLMQDTTLSRVTVDTPRENYALGDDVRVVVRARDPGFAPLPKADVVAEIDNDGRVSTVTGQTGADGDLVLTLPANHQGTHRVRVTVTQDDTEVGIAETVFGVTTRDPESDEVAPDSAFLQWLAGVSSGRYHAPGDLGAVWVDADAGRVVDERRETPLWRAPALALWIGWFAGLAWYVRRRAGLR